MMILLAGGGTGGHLFPGIALAQELRRRHPTMRLVFVGVQRGIEARSVPQAGFELRFLQVQGLRQKPWRTQLRGAVQLPWSLLQALNIMQSLKPQLAISLGGYAAGPVLLAARLLGVRCIVMEQNAVPGLTTRLLASFATRVISAMPCPALPAKKTQVLGNPVRPEVMQLRGQVYAPQTPLRLLVLGGSQGARPLNAVLLALAPLLRQLPPFLQITHQTGVAEASHVQQAYAQLGLNFITVVPFIDAIATAYATADLLLCRAGAMTLAEITLCGRPSILVPFAAAAGNHQAANAQVLVQAGAALCLAESDLQAPRLLKLLQDLAADPARLRRMAQQAHQLGKPQALDAIADAVLRELARV